VSGAEMWEAGMVLDKAQRPRRPDVGGAMGIFNVVVVGVAGLYAGTGSLWLTGIAGAVATALAGVYLVSGRLVRSADLIADADLAAITSADPALEPADKKDGARPVEDMIDAHVKFEEFFRSEYPRLVYVVMRLGADKAAAEDVVADVLTAMCRLWADIADPAGYAYRSVVNRYRSAESRSRGRTVPLDETSADGLRLADLGLGGREHRVLAAIGKLSGVRRLVMALHYAGFSTAEIAAEINTTESTVRSHLRHARRQLRELLAADDLL
jgi:RNA polymerase sigma factor (sigma-70 family)